MSRDTEDMDERELLGLAKASPVVRFSKAIFADAIKLKASDIHIEPQQESVVVRYRIDGIMREVVKTDKLFHALSYIRFQFLAKMDIAIRRKPQDGKFQIKLRDNQYDMEYYHDTSFLWRESYDPHTWIRASE